MLTELEPLQKGKLESPNEFHPKLNGRRCATVVMFISKVYASNVLFSSIQGTALPKQLHLKTA